MKKKICNVIIMVLVIALVVVVTMIIIRYIKNYLNEKDIAETLSIIEQKFEEADIKAKNDNKKENKNNKENEELLDIEYKGYKIEGIIEIPAIDIKYPIINETTKETMRVSITKFWGPEPNEIGNYTLAGHNYQDSTLFGKTKYLKIGDIIKITNLKNETVEYEIFDIYVIDANDVSCVESVESGTREVTLITCTNGHINRLITKAREKKDLN